MTNNKSIIAGIDAGGTSFKCAVATPDGRILAKERFPTSGPNETLAACAQFFKASCGHLDRRIAALGIASFGPVDVDPKSSSFGTILNTPKPNWSNLDLRSEFSDALGAPVNLDTDVNGALLAEMDSGAAKGCDSAAYITIGTGIGAGVFANGGLIGKPTHPEFGHIRIHRHKDDSFEGACSFHGDCLEGMASATAFTQRYGSPEDLPSDHEGWNIVASYLAQACWGLSLSFRPQRILLGGGLMLAPHLLDLVHEEYFALSGGYLDTDEASIANMIARPAHGDDAGLIGGLYLARQILPEL